MSDPSTINSKMLLPVVKTSVDVATLLVKLFQEDEYQGPLTYCPFHQHQRRSPSLHVFDDGSRWKCYSCHLWGDVIDFWRHAHKVKTGRTLSFNGAVQSLALLAGISVDAPTAATLATIARAIQSNPRGHPQELHRQLGQWVMDNIEPLFYLVRKSNLSPIYVDSSVECWGEVFTSRRLTTPGNERALFLEQRLDSIMNSHGRPYSTTLADLRDLQTMARRFIHEAEDLDEWVENLNPLDLTPDKG